MTESSIFSLSKSCSIRSLCDRTLQFKKKPEHNSNNKFRNKTQWLLSAEIKMSPQQHMTHGVSFGLQRVLI